MSIAVAEGLIVGDDTHAHLLGSRCLGCGSEYFPTAFSCRNPACDTKQLEQILLPRHGRLYSYTLQHYRPPPLFRCEPWAPYALGVIELSANLRVVSMLVGAPFEELSIGLRMELTLVPLFSDERGQPVLTYAFKPQDLPGPPS